MLILNEKNTKYDDRPPVSDYYTVIDSIEIKRSKNWWSAVVLHSSGSNRKAISFYLWNKRGDKWIRKQKFTIHNNFEFETLIEAVQQLMPKLTKKGKE